MEIINKKISDLIPYEKNPRKNKEAVKFVTNSIKEFGFKNPILIDKNNVIIAGHTRFEASKKLKLKEVPCIYVNDLTDEQIKAYRLVDNKAGEQAEWDFDLLGDELNNILNIDMSDFGFDNNINKSISDYTDKMESKSLERDFIIPPFSVLDTKMAYWQDRKKEWLKTGIKSEKGRKKELLSKSSIMNTIGQGTSIFDPVLCEVCYKWFNVTNGIIYDPFAGGSVRGVVAEKLGYKYKGIDLRQEQIEANITQAELLGVTPEWYADDSLNVDKYIRDNSIDMIFSCPPYGDLEKYSDKENDLSNMQYKDFKIAYKNIIDKACNKLKENRFAVFVVGDFRDRKGVKRNFVSYTIECFVENGLKLYNDAILLNAIGTGAIRARNMFKTRKLVNIHQYVLVFYKGDLTQIKNNYKEIETEI